MWLPSKNGLIYGAAAVAFVAYSVFLWRTAQHVQEADYLKQANKDLTSLVIKANTFMGQQEKLKEKQLTITKEIVREVEKPVYRDCHTTPDGVRLIEQAIDSYID